MFELVTSGAAVGIAHPLASRTETAIAGSDVGVTGATTVPVARLFAARTALPEEPLVAPDELPTG